MRRWLALVTIGFALFAAQRSRAQAPYVTLTGTMQGANGLPASNMVISLKPSQTFFVPGTNSTQQVGNIYGNGAPTSPCAVSGQFYTDTSTSPPTIYECIFSAWVSITAFANYGFNNITSGTNHSAAMLVGTGASLAPAGTGSIAATAIDGVTVTGTPTLGQSIVATSSSAAHWADSGNVTPALQYAAPYYSGGGTTSSISGASFDGISVFGFGNAPRAAGSGDLVTIGGVVVGPDSTQQLIQPPATSFDVNILDGSYNAYLYQSPALTGNNGIAGAFSAGAQTVVAPANYAYVDRPGFEVAGLSLTSNCSSLQDFRNGTTYLFFYNPCANNYDNSNGAMGIVANINATQGFAPTTSFATVQQRPLSLISTFENPGFKIGSTTTGPGGWNLSTGLSVSMRSNTAGISSGISIVTDKYATGDDQAGIDIEANSVGAAVAGADEGTALLRGTLHQYLYNELYAGTLSSTSTPGVGGSLVLTAVVTGKALAVGSDEPVIDTTSPIAGVTVTGKSVSGGIATLAVTVNSGSLPASEANGLTTSGIIVTNTGNSSTYQTISGITTTVNAGTWIPGHRVCVLSPQHSEASVITSVTGGTTLTIPLRYSHPSGAAIIQGGISCSYVEFTNYTHNSLKFNFIVLDADATHLFVTQQIQGGLTANNVPPAGPAIVRYGGKVIDPLDHARNPATITGQQFVIEPPAGGFISGDAIENPEDVSTFMGLMHFNFDCANPFGCNGSEGAMYYHLGGWGLGRELVLQNVNDPCMYNTVSGCPGASQYAQPAQAIIFDGISGGIEWEREPRPAPGQSVGSAVTVIPDSLNTATAFNLFTWGANFVQVTRASGQLLFNFGSLASSTGLDVGLNLTAGAHLGFVNSSNDGAYNYFGPPSSFNSPLGGDTLAPLNVVMRQGGAVPSDIRLGDPFNNFAAKFGSYGNANSTNDPSFYAAAYVRSWGSTDAPSGYPFFYLEQDNKASLRHAAWINDTGQVVDPFGIRTSVINPLVLPTTTGAGSAGSLAAGHYAIRITAIDALGAESSGSRPSADVVTSGATGSIPWAWPAVTGAVTYRIYNVANVGGAQAGNAFFTSATNSFTQTTFTAGSVGPPTVNKTGGFGDPASGYLAGTVLYAGAMDTAHTACTQTNGLCFGVPIYQGSGSTTPIISPHISTGAAEFTAGTVTVVLSGSEGFSGGSSYFCTANDTDNPLGVQVTQSDGTHFTLAATSGATDHVNFMCIGN